MTTKTDPTASYSDPTLLERQRARWPLALERARVKAQQLHDRGANYTRAGQMILASRNAPNLHQRVVWLHRAASAFADVFAPLAACRDGCGHCCRQGVAISGTEAHLLSRASGRPIAKNPDVLRTDRPVTTAEVRAAEADWRAQGKLSPCPFLLNERCSVYAHRPLVCRTLLNMDDDALLCQHSVDGSANVPYANARWLDDAAVALQPGAVWGDIRSFFPPAPGLGDRA